MIMESPRTALAAWEIAWPYIVAECRQVLGSELHYQALVYHCLRTHGGVSLRQIGMNVKQSVTNPVTPLFRQLMGRRHPDYRGGFEPIPDIVVFNGKIGGDWRRRRADVTLLNMLLAVEVKASERHNGRLTKGEIIHDIEKLAAHRAEVRERNGSPFIPVMAVIDTAPQPSERMRQSALDQCVVAAREHDIYLFYLGPEQVIGPGAGR